jgi:hypothetical protein
VGCNLEYVDQWHEKDPNWQASQWKSGKEQWKGTSGKGKDQWTGGKAQPWQQRQHQQQQAQTVG